MNFGSGDALVLSGLTFAAGVTAVLHGMTLSVARGGTSESFILDGAYAGEQFKVVRHGATARSKILLSVEEHGTVGADGFIDIGNGDRIYGEAGSDSFLVWGAPTLIDGEEGTDTVQVKADTTFTAGSLVDVEKIQVANGATADLSAVASPLVIQSLSTAGGSATATGTALADRFLRGVGADTFSGGDGRDVLSGRAGAVVLSGGCANDTLDGGIDHDADRFVFDSNVKAVPNVDVIRNFDRADRDTLVLDTDIFRQAGAVGTPSGDVLETYGKSVGAEDRILYRHLDTGDAGTDPDLINLYYDRNGGSTSDAVLFAKLTNQAAPVTAADFFLVA